MIEWIYLIGPSLTIAAGFLLLDRRLSNNKTALSKDILELKNMLTGNVARIDGELKVQAKVADYLDKRINRIESAHQ